MKEYIIDYGKTSKEFESLEELEKSIEKDVNSSYSIFSQEEDDSNYQEYQIDVKIVPKNKKSLKSAKHDADLMGEII